MAVVISDQLLDRSDRLLDAEPDEHLVALAQTGHEAAFAAIVRRYEPELLAQARRLSSDGRAEDAVQQAFLNAFAALQAGREVRHLRGWLHQILRNAVVRGRVPVDAPLDAASAYGEPLEETVQRRAEAHATLLELSALPDRQRDALLGTAVLGFPRAQVAQRMGLSEGAVRQLVHRARLRLRQAATALVPVPLAKLFAAVRSGGGATGSEAAIGAGTAASGGLAIKVGTLVASGVVATGLAVTHTLPGHHHHTGSPTGTRHHVARARGAGRLTEVPAFRAAASVAVAASLIVAPDRVSAPHDGSSGGPARLHGSGSGRSGPGPGRGHNGGHGPDSGARGDQGSGQSARVGDGGARGSTIDDGGGSRSGSTSGSGHSGSDSGATSSRGSGAGHDSSGTGGDGGGSGDASALSSTGADGARVGTDTSSGSSASGSDGSGGSGARPGSDGSGGASDGSGGGSGTSGGTTTSTQNVTQPSSGGGTTSGSDGGYKDSAASRDLSGSLDSSSS